MNMPVWLGWLAGTLLPLGALWTLFQLALRRERFFTYNRLLLLLAPLAGAAWPLLPHPVLPAWWSPAAGPASSGAAVLLPALTVGPATGAVAGSTGAHWPAVLLGLYAVGVGVGLTRLAYRYGQLRRAIRRLPREQRLGYVLAYTGGQLPTSSFGGTVLWDETACLTPAEAAPVLAHELTHVRQGHSYDVLWLELWRVVLWPNPFAHLLLPALRLTHELLADQAASATAAGLATPAAYPTLLARLAARQALGASYYALLQPFTFSLTLTRIAMLQSKIPVRRWKQWLVLPVLGGLFMAAGQSAAQTTPPPPPPPKMMPPSAKPDDKDKVYTYVEQMPQLPTGGNMKAIIEAIQSNIVYPAMKEEGRVFAKFTVGADGKVRDPSIVKGLNDAADNAVLQAIRQLPTFKPGMQNSKLVAVSFTVPVEFRKKP